MGLESIFGNIVDVLIKQVRCDLMLVKLGTVPHAFPQQLHLRHKWLIPSTGGERIKKMFKILPALATLDSIPLKFNCVRFMLRISLRFLPRIFITQQIY